MQLFAITSIFATTVTALAGQLSNAFNTIWASSLNIANKSAPPLPKSTGYLFTVDRQRFAVCKTLYAICNVPMVWLKRSLRNVRTDDGITINGFIYKRVYTSFYID